MFKFNQVLAKKYGVNNAIFLQKFADFDREIFSHSYCSMTKIFPFWTVRQIKTIVKSLREHNLICPIFNHVSSSNKPATFRISALFYTISGHSKSSNNMQYRTYLSDRFNSEPYALSNRYAVQDIFVRQHKNNTIYKFKYCSVQDIFVRQKTVYFSSRSRIALFCFAVDPILYKCMPGHFIYPTVMRLYMNKKNNNIINNKNNNNKKKVKKTMLSTSKFPASSVHYANSKFVLAELNSLVVPSCRERPFLYNPLNLGPIIQQLSRGYTVQDCIYVIKNKYAQWYTSSCMHSALQPKTLFSSNFENYLGEKKFIPKEKTYDGHKKTYSTASSRAGTTLAELGRLILEEE